MSSCQFSSLFPDKCDQIVHILLSHSFCPCYKTNKLVNNENTTDFWFKAHSHLVNTPHIACFAYIWAYKTSVAAFQPDMDMLYEYD